MCERRLGVRIGKKGLVCHSLLRGDCVSEDGVFIESRCMWNSFLRINNALVVGDLAHA